jgi:hypothetical protein
MLLSGGLLGAPVAEGGDPGLGGLPQCGRQDESLRAEPTRVSPEDLERMKARVEALQVLGLIPIVQPGPALPAREDER